jgi:hypothetical protein
MLFTVITHLSAAGLGLLAWLLFKVKPRIEVQEGKKVTSKFVSLLDHVGEGLKKFFTSPVATDIEETGITIAEAAWPGLTPMLSAVGASIAKAQALATAANVSGDTTAQVTALALSDAQQAFDVYEQTSGTTLETPQQQAIIQDVIALLGKLPAPGAAAPAAPAPVQVATAAPAASAPAPAVQVATVQLASVPAAVNGPGLAETVPQ